MAKRAPQYGVIDESMLTFNSPRTIDEGPFRTVEQAYAAAYEMLDTVDQVAIVRCRRSDRDAMEHVEILDYGCITITVNSDSWTGEEDE